MTAFIVAFVLCAWVAAQFGFVWFMMGASVSEEVDLVGADDLAMPADWFACRCGTIGEYADDAPLAERLSFYREREMHSMVHGAVMM